MMSFLERVRLEILALQQNDALFLRKGQMGKLALQQNALFLRKGQKGKLAL